MGALLEDLLVMEGSDDWLLWQHAGRHQAHGDVLVVSGNVGGLAGPAAVLCCKAHLAAPHLNDGVSKAAVGSAGLYLVDLFAQGQGLAFDDGRHRALPAGRSNRTCWLAPGCMISGFRAFRIEGIGRLGRTRL